MRGFYPAWRRKRGAIVSRPPRPAPDFVTVAHRTVPPFALHFSTTGEMADNLHDALTAASLTDADDPIMTWNGVSGAASVAPPARP